MKNWRTTVLGILGAGVTLATSKGWIDQDVATFLGVAIIAVFGVVSTDSINSIFGGRPDDRK